MAWMAAATLIRPDAMLAAGLIALHLLVSRRRLPWRPIAVYLIVLLPWVLYATWTYGSPLPITLSAKRAQGRMLISDSYLAGAWKMVTDHAQWPLYWLYLPLGVLGIWHIARKGRAWWLPLAWTVCAFSAYVVMGVTRYFWYYVPMVPGVVLVVASGVDWIRNRLSRARLGRRWRQALIAGLVAALLAPNVQGLFHLYTYPDPRVATYREIGQWIDAHLPQEASVGTLEVGIIGYYSQRPIVDFAGLIQPEMHTQMNRETTYQDTATWAVQRYRPTVLVLHSSWFPRWQESVLRACWPRHIVFQQGREGKFTVYECDWTG
jgi:hypothetical protein